ncbi:MAG: ADP-forming succinate--CoA ligase subunit beta [Alphaproteobacteria bacterium]|nr:ADP-forming succinate--CoA ligase subunit beta [Alphaproteobacteria bacterium]MDA7989246.1 ADP-forming succinate--CoA ligase subunit beta [Alphaproteobacteria bacterium]MDA8009900.1 ADP-forming succinate--CoA ligase subunit beta [Alphaproteobacteria bacterium]
MKLHEYQAKKLLRAEGVRVPDGVVVSRPERAEAAVAKLKGPTLVVKAQIHAGGRGKGKFLDGARRGKGGVAVVKGHAEAADTARQMLGATLRTLQTSENGQTVRKVWIEEASRIARELYLSILLDRARSRLVIVAAAEGGMGIEELAAEKPDAILRVALEPALPGGGWSLYVARRLALGLGFPIRSATAADFAALLRALVALVQKRDLSLLELNPLAVLEDGTLAALDAKVQADDSALFRHPDLARLEDPHEMAAAEREARIHDLSYVKLDGEIGCMVNGAGLAMATMDLISLAGGEPANFLDVGGGASQEKVEAAFRIILRDRAVKAILINIFGGIMRCDVIAEGVVAAARARGLRVPLVVRLEGTKAEEGRRILASSGLAITPAEGLHEAAVLAVEASRSAKARAGRGPAGRTR